MRTTATVLALTLIVAAAAQARELEGVVTVRGDRVLVGGVRVRAESGVQTETLRSFVGQRVTLEGRPSILRRSFKAERLVDPVERGLLGVVLEDAERPGQYLVMDGGRGYPIEAGPFSAVVAGLRGQVIDVDAWVRRGTADRSGPATLVALRPRRRPGQPLPATLVRVVGVVGDMARLETRAGSLPCPPRRLEDLLLGLPEGELGRARGVVGRDPRGALALQVDERSIPLEVCGETRARLQALEGREVEVEGVQGRTLAVERLIAPVSGGPADGLTTRLERGR